MPTPLMIIDVQRGFVNDATYHVPGRVAELQPQYGTVIATRFVNPPGSPYRNLIHWNGFAPGSADTEFAFTPRPSAVIIEKRRYGCIDRDFLDMLRRCGADTVHLCGIATDNCVLKCAVDLFEAGVRPIVLSGACGSHGGADYHEWGLKILARLIGKDQIAD